MPPPGACPYISYEETYRATALALASDGADALRAVAEAIERLEGRQALVASTAAFDAMNQIPMRPLVQLCRLRLFPVCGSGRDGCGQSSREGGTLPRLTTSSGS